MNSRWIFILNGLLLGLILLSNLFSSYRRMTYSKLKKPPHLHSRVEQLRSKSTTSQRRHKNKTLKIKAKASSLKPEVTKQIQQEQPKNTSILDREILVAKDKAHFYLSTLSKVEAALFQIGDIYRRILIVSSWRSGSSFTGRLFGYHPLAYYQEEPLRIYGIRRFSKPSNESESSQNAIQLVKSLLTCDIKLYHNLTTTRIQRNSVNEYFSMHRLHHSSYFYKNGCRGRGYTNICNNWLYIDSVCRNIPVKAVKLDRMGLVLASELLNIKELQPSLKMIYLVRDPRAVIASRKKTTWCSKTYECIDPKRLCNEMVNDFQFAQTLPELFKDNIRLLRYEDLVVDVKGTVEQLFAFVGLQVPSVIKRGIFPRQSEWTDDQFGNMGHFLNKWKVSLTLDEIQSIEENCSTAFELWGYRKYDANSKAAPSFLKTYNANFKLQ